MKRLALLLIAGLWTPLLACGRDDGGQARDTNEVADVPPAQARWLTRTPDEVFSDWRPRYADLIGRTKDAALERFGMAYTEETPGLLSWATVRDGTDDRRIDVGLTEADTSGVIFLVKVYARSTEKVDPIEVLKRAPVFEFETGSYVDSTQSYLLATTKDGRNGLQFNIAESGVTFQAAVFEDPDIRAKSRRPTR